LRWRGVAVDDGGRELKRRVAHHRPGRIRSPRLPNLFVAGDALGGLMKFVYMVTTGTDDPTKASLPLHLAANGSLEVGHDTSVLLAGDATEMLLGDNLEQMQGIGVPPVRELIAKLRDHSVPVYV
jgi:hypothetical protein